MNSQHYFTSFIFLKDLFQPENLYSMHASKTSLHVCQYQTGHYYKLIPQPQEGLHNGPCVVGVTQAPPTTPGSKLTVSNESTQQNLSTRPGPKEMYVLTLSGMTTPLLD